MSEHRWVETATAGTSICRGCLQFMVRREPEVSCEAAVRARRLHVLVEEVQRARSWRIRFKDAHPVDEPVGNAGASCGNAGDTPGS